MSKPDEMSRLAALVAAKIEIIGDPLIPAPSRRNFEVQPPSENNAASSLAIDIAIGGFKLRLSGRLGGPDPSAPPGTDPMPALATTIAKRIAEAARSRGEIIQQIGEVRYEAKRSLRRWAAGQKFVGVRLARVPLDRLPITPVSKEVVVRMLDASLRISEASFAGPDGMHIGSALDKQAETQRWRAREARVRDVVAHLEIDTLAENLIADAGRGVSGVVRTLIGMIKAKPMRLCVSLRLEAQLMTRVSLDGYRITGEFMIARSCELEIDRLWIAQSLSATIEQAIIGLPVGSVVEHRFLRDVGTIESTGVTRDGRTCLTLARNWRPIRPKDVGRDR